jgi:hypothetical protein
MMTILIVMIRILSIGWFISELPTMYLKLKSVRIKKFIDILNLMGCVKCNAFWIGLLLTGNFWIAVWSSFIAYLIDKYILTTPTEL